MPSVGRSARRDLCDARHLLGTCPIGAVEIAMDEAFTRRLTTPRRIYARLQELPSNQRGRRQLMVWLDERLREGWPHSPLGNDHEPDLQPLRVVQAHQAIHHLPGPAEDQARGLRLSCMDRNRGGRQRPLALRHTAPPSRHRCPEQIAGYGVDRDHRHLARREGSSRSCLLHC
jgi:hypothetical protein